MSINKLLVVACAAGLMAVAGCDNNDANRTTSSNDNVKHEAVTGVNTNDLNKSDEEKGSAKVEVQKEQTRTITSEERVPTVASGPRKLDINRMSSDDWQAIGVPKATADNIVSYRKDHDGFKSVDELSSVPGMSPAMIAPLRNKLGLSH